MLDKQPFELNEFKGVNRGSANIFYPSESQDSVNFLEAINAKNIIFLKEGGIQTRPRFISKRTLTPQDPPDADGVATIYWKISRLGTTYYDNRWLWLSWDDIAGVGRFYDTATGTILATITGCKYASVINIFGRIYISPLSDWGVPLTGTDGVIWLYDGTTFRKAGGSAPAGATLTITDTAVGGANVTAGLHIGAIAFETDTGFITPAGPSTRIQVTIAAGGGRAARFNNIDTGPAGTVARHLLLTKSIPTYDGIQDNWELFFALRIADNVTTTADVIIPDTGLVDSADYLLSEYTNPPACNSISSIGSRLIYNGINTDTRVINISKSADPETIDQTEDYIQIYDGIPEDIYNGAELRGLYYIFKESCTYVTTPDPSSPPNEWVVNLVDSGIGISPFGIAQVLANHGGLVLDNLIVGGSAGVYIFSGTFQSVPLSNKLQAIFRSLSRAQAMGLRMHVDPIRKRLFLMPGNNELWVGDYYLGLDPQNIRWVQWTGYHADEGGNPIEDTPIHMFVDPNNAGTIPPNVTILFQNFITEPDETVSSNGDSYDGPTTLPWEYESGFTANPEISSLYTFARFGLRALAIEDSVLDVSLRVQDDSADESLISFNVGILPKISYWSQLNLVAEKVRVKFSGTKNIFINKFILWVSKRADGRPV